MDPIRHRQDRGHGHLASAAPPGGETRAAPTGPQITQQRLDELVKIIVGASHPGALTAVCESPINWQDSPDLGAPQVVGMRVHMVLQADEPEPFEHLLFLPQSDLAEDGLPAQKELLHAAQTLIDAAQGSHHASDAAAPGVPAAAPQAPPQDMDRHGHLLRRLDNDFTYHRPHGDQAKRYEELRAAGKELALAIVARVPDGRERALALTQLEQAIFWANAGIARGEPEPYGLSSGVAPTQVVQEHSPATQA